MYTPKTTLHKEGGSIARTFVTNVCLPTLTIDFVFIQVRYKEVNEEEWTSKLVRNNANLSAIGDVREILLSELLFNNAYYLNVSLFNNVTNSIRVGPSVLVGPIITRDPGNPCYRISTVVSLEFLLRYLSE